MVLFSSGGRTNSDITSTKNSLVNSVSISDRKWEKTRLWLARALVSEAGWEETLDHVAIAYVLYRRLEIARRTYPRYSMINVIKRYCAGFGQSVPTPRQHWVINLRLDGKRPKGWPDDIHWRDYKDRWLKVLDTVDEWRKGGFDDPCRGLSRYWGGPMDRPSARMVRMDCGPTKNWFYTVRRKKGEIRELPIELSGSVDDMH